MDPHLPVKPGDGVSVSEALEATHRLLNRLLLAEALGSRLEHKRHASVPIAQIAHGTKQGFILHHAKIKQMRQITLAAFSLSSKRRVTKSSKRCEPEVCRDLEGRP